MAASLCYGNVGCITTRDTVSLARVAESVGIDVIVVITPYYLKASQDELADHYIEVCRAVRLPVLAYNFPPTARPGSRLPRSAALPRLPEPRRRQRLQRRSRARHRLSRLRGRPQLPVLVGPENLIVTALDNGLAGSVTRSPMSRRAFSSTSTAPIARAGARTPSASRPSLPGCAAGSSRTLSRA